jgi:hypothetical protein
MRKSKHNLKDEIDLLSDDETNDVWYLTITESLT